MGRAVHVMPSFHITLDIDMPYGMRKQKGRLFEEESKQWSPLLVAYASLSLDLTTEN